MPYIKITNCRGIKYKSSLFKTRFHLKNATCFSTLTTFWKICSQIWVKDRLHTVTTILELSLYSINKQTVQRPSINNGHKFGVLKWVGMVYFSFHKQLEMWLEIPPRSMFFPPTTRQPYKIVLNMTKLCYGAMRIRISPLFITYLTSHILRII